MRVPSRTRQRIHFARHTRDIWTFVTVGRAGVAVQNDASAGLRGGKRLTSGYRRATERKQSELKSRVSGHLLLIKQVSADQHCFGNEDAYALGWNDRVRLRREEEDRVVKDRKEGSAANAFHYSERIRAELVRPNINHVTYGSCDLAKSRGRQDS